jgi:DNA-binding GntR family transcriptional regulator
MNTRYIKTRPSRIGRDGTPLPATLTEQAFDAIKRQIIQLDLPPGGRFTEAQLASELGLSKTPVREALARLEREGLVEVIARSGYRVCNVTLKDARDLLALRTLLETEAAGLAAARIGNGAHLQAINELCRISYDPSDRSSIARFLEANTEFHATVAEAGENKRLAAMLRTVLDQLERLFHLGLALTTTSEEMVHEHHDLVRAIMSGNVAEARAVAESQSRASQLMVLEGLASSPSVLAANIVAAPFPMTRPDAASIGNRP